MMVGEKTMTVVSSRLKMMKDGTELGTRGIVTMSHDDSKIEME
jgi:hypothetical protein